VLEGIEGVDVCALIGEDPDVEESEQAALAAIESGEPFIAPV